MPSDGRVRPTQHAPGGWCAAHGVTPPPGSFIDDLGRNWVEEWPRYVASMGPVGGGQMHGGPGAPGQMPGCPFPGGRPPGCTY